MSEHAVVTTIRPDVVLVVDDAEYLDLRRYGLIADAEEIPEGAAAKTPAPAAAHPRRAKT